MRREVIVLAMLLAGMQSGAASGTTVVIGTSGFSFSPAAVTIAPGDSVRWNWISGFHTTTSGTGSLDPQSGVLWNAPLDVTHPTFVRQFTSAGTFPYYCSFHEAFGMAGTITVNTPPVARDTSVTTLEDTPVGSQLQAYDPDGNPLTYTILTGPFHGTRSGLNVSTGAFTYTPGLNYNGRDSLTFRVNDGKANSPIDTVYFTVAVVNDPPVAQDLNATANVNTPLAFGAMPVSDVDNVSWTVTQTNGPFNGSVSLFNPPTGSFTYTPSLNYLGPDSIKFRANDGQDNSNTATIRIQVISGCACPNQGDVSPDGFVDVFDVIQEIAIAFSGGADITDPGCPTSRGDVNNDGFVDVFDVIAIIGVAFSGGTVCDPCTHPGPC